MAESNYMHMHSARKFSQPLRVIVFRCAAFILVSSVLFWFYFELANLGMNYEWRWNRLWRHLGQWTSHGFVAGPLLKGIGMTMVIALAGFVFSALLGLAVCLVRLSAWPVWRLFAKIYISVLRNTPLLLQLFFIYFLVSPLLKTGPLATAIISLSLFEAAYVAEIFRSALLSVPKTQWEAGLSLGFGLAGCLFQVILPQACRNALPAFTNQAIAILKDTSLVSAIAVADLTMRAQALVAETFMAFEVWLLAGAIYLVLALAIALPGLLLEKRQAWR